MESTTIFISWSTENVITITITFYDIIEYDFAFIPILLWFGLVVDIVVYLKIDLC